VYVTSLTLELLAGRIAVCRLDAGAAIPDPPVAGLWSATRTASELSIVLPEDAVQPGWKVEPGWCALEVAGPLDLGLTGVLLSLTRPLAEAGVPVFAISTFDTDYVMVKDHHLDRALAALRTAGHVVSGA
jgi:hypothetical protein